MATMRFRLRPVHVLAFSMLMMAGLMLAKPAWAETYLRLPDNAVNAEGQQDINAPEAGPSDADIWRYLKQGGGGDPTSLPGDIAPPSTPGYSRTLIDRFLYEIMAPETGLTSNAGRSRVIQVLGEDWRLLRSTYVLPYAGWVLAGVVALLALFYLIRGRIRIEGGRSGKTIPRFSMSHRIAHWFLASTFILMAVSGLLILLGRPYLVPLIGKDPYAVIASASLQGHNLFGPIFIVALLGVIVRFMRGNFFQWADLKWIIKGGGLLGGHASSNHYNFGEKTWYWIVVFVGLMMSATGLFLLFPWVSEVLALHQLATILHAGGAILMISIALGHAYIGSIGMEGSLDSMTRGEVDENWAREHHDLWYEEVTGKTVVHDTQDDAAPDAATVAEGST